MDEIVLALSKDREWHTINELSTYPQLRKTSMTALTIKLEFLEDVGMVELMGDAVLEARITADAQRFVRRIRWIERSEHRKH